MELFEGRRCAAGTWVAYGPASDVEHVVATRELVEHVQPNGTVRRVRLAHAGRRFTTRFGDEALAYGYPIAIATTEENDQ